MKNVRRIIIWAMLSIMLQVAGLLFLDQVIFKESYDINIQGEEIKGDQIEKDRDIDYDIPSNAEDIKVSDDTRYIAYFQNAKLMVLDTKDLNAREITTQKGEEILYAKWILDEDILVIAQKESDGYGNSKINVINYNVKYDYEQPVTKAPLCRYYDGMKVQDIVQSSKTNTTYVGLSRTGFSSSIYRIDVNYNVNKIVDVGELKAFKAMQREDVIVYQDTLYDRINACVSGVPKKLGITNMNSYILLGIDDEGIIYLGKLTTQGEIDRIVYGNMDTSFSNWQNITLNSSVLFEDIYLTKNNEILVNDRLKGKIQNITNKSAAAIEYKGQLLQLSNDFICSTDNGKIVMKSLNEDGQSALDEKNASSSTNNK